MKLDDIHLIFAKLEEENVRYILVGGMAVLLHGYGRFTADVDLVIQLEPENIRRAFRVLESLGYQPRVPVTSDQFANQVIRESWIRDKGMTVLNLHSPQHKGTPIDIFVSHPFSFDDTYSRSDLYTLDDGTSIRTVDLDNLIQMKEQAGREKDRVDLVELRRLKALNEL